MSDIELSLFLFLPLLLFPCLCNLLLKFAIVVILGTLFDFFLVDNKIRGSVWISIPGGYHISLAVSHGCTATTLTELSKEASICGLGALVHLVDVVPSIRRAENMPRWRPNLLGWLLGLSLLILWLSLLLYQRILLPKLWSKPLLSLDDRNHLEAAISTSCTISLLFFNSNRLLPDDFWRRVERALDFLTGRKGSLG